MLGSLGRLADNNVRFELFLKKSLLTLDFQDVFVNDYVKQDQFFWEETNEDC